jgi:hypothetical protein
MKMSTSTEFWYKKKIGAHMLSGFRVHRSCHSVQSLSHSLTHSRMLFLDPTTLTSSFKLPSLRAEMTLLLSTCCSGPRLVTV